jgi:hypothetical protein
MQRIVQFIGIAHVWPRFLLHLRDGCGIERSDFFEDRRGQHSPHFDGSRSAFFKRRIV